MDSGGYFKTILDMDRSSDNLDRLGAGRIPNKVNGEFINEWIAEGGSVEPFRAMYPEVREVSYVSYRGVGGLNIVRDFNKSRLDFFLLSPEILGLVHSVVYEDRLSMDFDHKEVSSTLGTKPTAGKMVVFDDTLLDPISEYIGKLAIYECLAAHLAVGDRELTRDVAQLDILIRGLELNLLIVNTAAGGEIVEENIRTGIENIRVVTNRLEGFNILERDFTCNYRSLYEVVLISLKNKLMEVQGRIKANKTKFRDDLIKRCEYMADKFGEQLLQAEDCRAELLRHDDVNLKMRAGKYREFLESNNEKATRAFCRLNKEGGCNDDVTQIRDDDNAVFKSNNERGKYIGKFYSELLKKKLDRLMAIEDFLTAECCGEDWVQQKKLTEEEKMELEGEVTLRELTDALDNSNFSSSSGWEGLSFKVIRKFWDQLGPLMLKMTKETFSTGELTETFKMGLINNSEEG
jgi:hypothetical protein